VHRRWLAGALWVTFIALTVVNLVASVRQAGSPSLGWSLALLLVGILAVFTAILAAMGNSARRRNGELRQGSEDAVSWTTGRDHGLIPALSELTGTYVSRAMPMVLSVVIDRDGLRIVGGSSLRPQTIIDVPRQALVDCRAARLTGSYTNQAGIEIRIRRDAAAPVTLPLPVFGRGPGGMFPSSFAAVSKLAIDITRLLESSARAEAGEVDQTHPSG